MVRSQASGAISSDVEVTKIVEVKDITGAVGGGAADKLLIEVEYNKPSVDWLEADMPTTFFCKIPCKDEDRKLLSATLGQTGPEVAFGHM